MKVILRSDVENLGHKGDVVDVAAGYASNFLFPRGLALQSSAGAEAQAEKMRKARAIKDAADRAEATEVATRLVPTTITVVARVGAEGRLFGSVGVAEIVDAVATQAKVELGRNQVRLQEPIKEAGTHQVTVKLHPDVEFPVNIEVVGS